MTNMLLRSTGADPARGLVIHDLDYPMPGWTGQPIR